MGDQGAYEMNYQESFGTGHQLVHQPTEQYHYLPYGMAVPGATSYGIDAGYDEMFNDGSLGLQMRQAPLPPKYFPKSVSGMRGNVDFSHQGMMSSGSFHDGDSAEMGADDAMLRRMRKPVLGVYNPHLQGGGQKRFYQ